MAPAAPAAALPLGGFVPVDPGQPAHAVAMPPPLPAKRGLPAIAIVLIVLGGVAALVVLSAVVFVLVSNLGAADPGASAFSAASAAWADDAGSTVAAGLLLYNDDFSDANDNLQRERYAAAQSDFSSMRATADQVDSDLLVMCYDSDALARCDEMRDHWQELSYAAQKGWGCSYNLENDYYGDDDCEDAIAAMDGLPVRIEAIGDILREWGYLE